MTVLILLATLLSCARPSESAAGGAPTDAIRLTFDIQPGDVQTCTLQKRETTTRSDKVVAEDIHTSLEHRRWSLAPDGRLFVETEREQDGEPPVLPDGGDTLKPDLITYLQTLPDPPDGFRVTADGRFHAMGRTDDWEEEVLAQRDAWLAELDPYRAEARNGTAIEALTRFMNHEMNPELLQASTSRVWEEEVGDWVGRTLALGERAEDTFELDTPFGLNTPFTTSRMLQEWQPCSDADTGTSCVLATRERTSSLDFIQEQLRAAGRDETLAADVFVVWHDEQRFEPDTLRLWSLTSTFVIGNESPSAWLGSPRTTEMDSSMRCTWTLAQPARRRGR